MMMFSSMIARGSALLTKTHRCVLGALLSTLVILSACSATDSIKPSAVGASDAVELSTQHSWTLLDFENISSTHTASETAVALLETHLRGLGVTQLVRNKAQSRYVVQGKISRWHYAGTAGRAPEISLRLDVFDSRSNTLVWSDSVSGDGRRRESLTGYANRLMGSLVKKLPLGSSYSLTADELIAQASSDSFNSNTQTHGELPVYNVLGLQKGLPDIAAEAIHIDTPLAGRSVAFYYADNPPINILSQFDRLVLEPDNIDASELPLLTAQGAAAFAYLSIGEVGPDRAYASEVKPEWILGVNPAWNSRIFDLANTGLQDFLIERVAVLVKRGYQGIFLDTMDSFNLVADTESEKIVQQAALVKLVRRIGMRFPELRIITNRGFEVIDQIADQVEAVAAESLYASWDNTGQRYGSVPASDRLWLIGKLEQVKNDLDLDVIVIDYVAPDDRAKARSVARDIAKHGYIPWVARPELDNIGVGALEVVPREVLLVFDSRIDGALEISALHRYVAAPLEYMGYIPVYIDRAGDSLPAGELSGRYAGVTTWPVETYKDPELTVWLQKQLDDALPVAMFSKPPVSIDSLMARSMGISLSGDMDHGSAKVFYSDDMIKPELALPQRIDYVGLVSRSVAPANTTHMSYQDNVGNKSDVTVTGPFGGYAWHPSTVQSGLDYQSYWIVDPFKFLKKALRLPDTPMPDVTSENGKRLWIAHIDGDALPSWAEMPGRQLGAEVIYDRILTQYKLPHTVSVVEAEMTAFPAFFDRSKKMFDIARKTFKLDNVELASHTFSHPFKWKLLGDYKKTGRYNLNVPGYEFSAEREVAGSIDFIDSTLAPEGKRTAAMLWSGDALPEEDALASAHRLGVPNMNGGFTQITRDAPTHTLVGPMARPVGDYLQIYAPIMNENVYTDDWQGPFDGFRRVIDTFEMTEFPRRLKPLNIYYHFYSGTKIASMRALEEVYEWSVTQDIHPLYVSEYANKVPDYRQAGVARYLDGRWKLSRLGHIRSIRLLNTALYPDLRSSEGISGARGLHDGMYIHTDGRDSVSFMTSNTKPSGIHLVSSNGRVADWNTNSGVLEFRVIGNVPVNIELGGALSRTCTIQANNKLVQGRLTAQNTMSFTFTTRDTGNAILNCQA